MATRRKAVIPYRKLDLSSSPADFRMRDTAVNLKLIEIMASRTKPEELFSALIWSDQERFAAVAQELMEGASWVGICRRYKLTVKDLIMAIREYHFDKAAMMAFRAMPDVVQEVANAAVRHDEPCPECRGYGVIVSEALEGNGTVEQTCTQCMGEATVSVPGDRDAQRMMLELGGLLGKNRQDQQQVQSQQTNVIIDLPAITGQVSEIVSRPVNQE